MTDEMLGWLMACPDVLGVSTLTADIHACGILDIGPHLTRAIADAVRHQTWSVYQYGQPPGYHERTARMYACRPKLRRLTILRGVAVLQGALSRGAGMSETCGRAVVHIRTVVPQTVITGSPGRQMRDLVDSPVFRRDAYPILSAAQDDHGLTLWFRTPARAVPLVEVARRLGV